jgi:DNA-binding NtrC family response regulator
MGESLSDRLALEGLSCDWHLDAQSALRAIEERQYAAIVSDIRLPDYSGEQLFLEILERESVVPPTLFITGYGSVAQAVRLMRLGARDYITKPFDIDDLLNKLHTMCPTLFTDDEWLQHEPDLGISPVMRHIQDVLARAAARDARVLLTGESGVGKEYAARYFHTCLSASTQVPFHAVNCAALQENLLEAELFGYEKGAFTGSVRSYRGVFERADGGILFLDEIGDMSPAMQAKLLRVLQDGCVERLGSEKSKKVQVSLVCATNHDLGDLVHSGDFREDLYFRINVVSVPIPPLRERTEDILWFARMFLQEYRQKNNLTLTFGAAAEKYLLHQPWPGNLRELRHAIERASIFAPGDVIDVADFTAMTNEVSAADTSDLENLKSYLDQCEHDRIIESLEEHQWHMIESADALGISRKNLWEKMRKHKIRR